MIKRLLPSDEELIELYTKEHLEIHRSIEKLIKPLLEKKIIGFKKGGYYIISEDGADK